MADRRARKIFGNPVPVSKKIRRKIFGNSVPVSKKIRLFFALAFFLPPCFLAGQELSPPESEGSSYIERTGEELRFIQRLVWEKAEYAHRYEITVERENNSGEYTEIYREFRTENFTDLSLAPGLYRYRIQAYNLLDRPAGLSSWIPFRVIPALQPELYSFSQEFLPAGDPRGDVAITLYGRNLVEGSEVRLDPAVTPPAYVPSGESARLVFDRELLVPGLYRVYIKNPGGLESSLEITVRPRIADSGSDAGSGSDGSFAAPASSDTVGDSEIVPRRLFDLYVTAEYAPLVPLYGDLFNKLDRSFYPGGASARIAFIFLKPSWGDLGLELAPSWNMLNAGAITIHLYPLHLNGICQLRLPGQNTALVFRLGGGINLMRGTNNQSSDSFFTWIPSADVGAAFRWFIHGAQNFRRTTSGTFYLEAGIEYTHVFSAESPQPGYIRPGIGVGWRF